jgi:endonuclease I
VDTQDPPDTFEQRRNQVIYDQFQHSRNPFIDHPEWATSIYG